MEKKSCKRNVGLQIRISKMHSFKLIWQASSTIYEVTKIDEQKHSDLHIKEYL